MKERTPGAGFNATITRISPTGDSATVFHVNSPSPENASKRAGEAIRERGLPVLVSQPVSTDERSGPPSVNAAWFLSGYRDGFFYVLAIRPA